MKKIIVSGVLIAALAVTGLGVFADDVLKESPKGANSTVSITDEQQEILKEKIKVDLEEMLKAEDITKEQYDHLVSVVEKGKIPGKGRMGKPVMERKELTEEQKAKMTEDIKARLNEKLQKEEITQQEYDEAINKLESGEMVPMGIKGFGRGRGKKPGFDGNKTPSKDTETNN